MTQKVSVRTCVYKLKLLGQDKKYVREVFAYSVSNFGTDVPNWRKECALYPHLKDLKIPKVDHSIAEILIGIDCIDLFGPMDVRYRRINGPVKKNLKCWTLH